MLFKKLILFRGDLILIALTLFKKKEAISVSYIWTRINEETKINIQGKHWSNWGKILVGCPVGNVEIGPWKMLKKWNLNDWWQ